jgi:hypothetical protein
LQANFFESLDGTRRLGVMTRARRQLAIAHRSQLSAQRLLRHGDLVFLPEPLAEIDDPPADHLMHRRDRTVLDHRHKCGAMLVIQPRWLAGRLAVDQSIGTTGVEPEHPVSHNLHGDPADFGCLRAAASLVDHRQRQ